MTAIAPARRPGLAAAPRHLLSSHDLDAEGQERLLKRAAALRDFEGGLGELRSLAVADTAQGRGMGEMLVRAIVRDAREAGIRKLYVLTANPGYFALHGFEEVAWDEVPEVLDADRASGIARRRWNTAMVLSP